MRRLPTLCGIPTAIALTSRSPCTFEQHSANAKGRFKTASKLSCVTAAPGLMQRSGASGRSAKSDQVDWDCTLSTMPWTSWSSAGRTLRTGYGSSSIWGKRVLPSEGEDTVQISVRRQDRVTIFDLFGGYRFCSFPGSAAVAVARDPGKSHTARGDKSQQGPLHRQLRGGIAGRRIESV